MDVRKSCLSKELQEPLMEHFVFGSTARCASETNVVGPRLLAWHYLKLMREVQASDISLGADADSTI